MNSMKKIFLTSALLAVVMFSAAPAVHAASLEVSGWIPYWRTEAGTKDA